MKVSYILHSSIARTSKSPRELISQTAVLPEISISLWDVLRCHRIEEDEGDLLPAGLPLVGRRDSSHRPDGSIEDLESSVSERICRRVCPQSQRRETVRSHPHPDTSGCISPHYRQPSGEPGPLCGYSHKGPRTFICKSTFLLRDIKYRRYQNTLYSL